MSEEKNVSRVASLKELNQRLVKEVSSLRDQLSARSTAGPRIPGSGEDPAEAIELRLQAETEGLMAKAKSLKTELEEAHKDKDELNREISILRESGRRRMSVPEDVEALQIRNNYLVAEARALRAENKSFDGRYFEEMHALQAQVEMLTSEKAAVEKELALCKANVVDSSRGSGTCGSEYEWSMVRSRSAPVPGNQPDINSSEDAGGDVFSSIQGQMVDISDSLDRIASENQAVDKSRREAKKRIKNAEVKLQMMVVHRETQVHRHECDIMMAHEYAGRSPRLVDSKGDRQDVMVAEVQRELETLRACLPRGRLGEETDGLRARLGKVVQYIEMYEAENSVKERESAEKLEEALEEMKRCRTKVDSLGSQLAAMESANANEVRLRDAAESRTSDLSKRLDASQLIINEKMAAEQQAKCKNTEMDNEIKVLISRLAEKDTLNESSAVDRAALQNELDDVKSRLASQIEQQRLKNEHTEVKIKQLVSQHEKDEKASQSLKSELEKLSASLASSLAENVDLRSQISSAEDSALKNLAELQKELDHAGKMLDKALASESNVLGQLEASEKRMGDITVETEVFKARVLEMSDLLNQAENEKKLMCEKLVAEQQARDLVSKELQRLQEERGVLISAKEELHVLQQKWDAQQPQIGKLEKEAKEFTAKIEGYIEREGNLRREAAQSRFALEKSTAECEKLNTELNQAQKSNADLKADMAASQIESEGLIMVSKELQNAVDMANQEIQEKESKLAEAEKAASDGAAERDALLAEKSALLMEKESIELARDAAEKTLIETEKEAMRAFKELDESQTSVATLTKEVESVLAELACSRAEREDACAQLKSAVEERDVAIEKISEVEEGAGKEREKVEQLLADLDGKGKELTEVVEEKEEILCEVSRVKKDLAEQVDRSSKLAAEVVEKSEEIEHLTEDLQNKEERLESIAGERDAVWADLEKLQAELDEHKADFESYSQDRETEKVDYEKRIEVIVTECNDAIQENIELHTKVLKRTEAVEKLKYRIESKAMEIENIMQERHNDTEAMVCLKNELAEEANRVKDLEQESCRRAEEIECLNRVLKDVQDEVKASLVSLETAESEKDGAVKQLVSMITKHALQQAILSEWKEKFAAASEEANLSGKERDRALAEVKTLKSGNRMHVEMIEILTARCYDKEEMIEKLKEEMFEVQKELGASMDDLKFITEDRNNLKGKLEAVEKEIREHQATISDLENQCEAREEEILKANDALRESERAIEGLENDLGETQHSVLILKSRLKGTQEERDGFQDQLNRVTVKSRELEVHVEKTRQQIGLVQEDLMRSESEKKEMDAALEMLKEERDKALGELEVSRADTEKLSCDLGKSVSDMESQCEEFAKMEEQLKSAVTQAESRSKYLEDMSRNRNSEITRLKSDLEAMYRQKGEVQHTLSRAMADRAGVAQELQNATNREMKLRVLLEDMKMEGLNLVSTQKQERESFQVEKANMERIIVEKTRAAAGVAELERQLKDMAAKESALMSDITALSDANQEATRRISDLDSELEMRKEQENSLKQSIEERDGLEEVLEKTQDRLRKLQGHSAQVESQIAKLQKDSVKKEALLVEEMRVLEGKLKLDVQKALSEKEVAETTVQGLRCEMSDLETRLRGFDRLSEELEQAKESENRLKTELQRATSHGMLNENLIADLREDLAALEEEVVALKGAKENECRLKTELEKDLAEKREVERQAKELISQIASLEKEVSELKEEELGDSVIDAEGKSVQKRGLPPGMLSQMLGLQPENIIPSTSVLNWQQENFYSPRTWTGEVGKDEENENYGTLPGSVRACSMPTLNQIEKNVFSFKEGDHRAQSCPGDDDMEDNLLLTDEVVILESSSEEGHHVPSPSSATRVSRSHSFELPRQSVESVEEEIDSGGILEEPTAVKTRELDISNVVNHARNQEENEAGVSDPMEELEEMELQHERKSWLMMGLGSTMGATLVVLAGVLVRACGRGD
ncbi:hypothetical protein BSKO_07926 [Bryopsis sp. KO-2023]|nr:hypothetical protein BSKO_07926 [Bryopsis sp. KO-2023]